MACQAILPYLFISKLKKVFSKATAMRSLEGEYFIMKKMTVMATITCVSTFLLWMLFMFILDMPHVGVPVDLFFNTLCAFCTFKFGEPLYNCLFHPCVKRVKLFGSSGQPEQLNDLVGSQTGPDGSSEQAISSHETDFTDNRSVSWCCCDFVKIAPVWLNAMLFIVQ